MAKTRMASNLENNTNPVKKAKTTPISTGSDQNNCSPTNSRTTSGTSSYSLLHGSRTTDEDDGDFKISQKSLKCDNGNKTNAVVKMNNNPKSRNKPPERLNSSGSSQNISLVTNSRSEQAFEKSTSVTQSSSLSHASGTNNKDICSEVAGVLQKLIKNQFSSYNENSEKEFFCIEDTLLSTDLEVFVGGIGSLTFPIDKRCVGRMLEISSIAKFSNQSTQMIPANKLKVAIEPDALKSLLQQVEKRLFTPLGSSLELHLQNLLIYGPGQFLKNPKDTDKPENVVASLVIVLPSPHKGGDLIIEHNGNKHMFFGSQKPGIVKCVAFYSGCDREVKEVTEGYRVALTYNIVQQVHNISEQTNRNEFFCIEDTLLSKDLDVAVVGMEGSLPTPIVGRCIGYLSSISVTAGFTMGKASILDTNVRNTKMIPADKLKVTIKPEVLKSLLELVGKGLLTPPGSSLELHLQNLLIYGPGMFFKKHKDREKLENMVGSLVIVLPSPHKGGDLIIEHNGNKHVFFGSQNPDIIKCVAFYSDCDHEVKEVTEGYRIALTYSIVLQTQHISGLTNINQSLDEVVQKHFDKGEEKLIYFMNHCYTENSLRWNLLKAEDRLCANALLAVARKQGRIACLALAKIYETNLVYWVDENNIGFKTPSGSQQFKPEIDGSGLTGNADETENLWYQTSCVVLFADAFKFDKKFSYTMFDYCHMTQEQRKKFRYKFSLRGD